MSDEKVSKFAKEFSAAVITGGSSGIGKALFTLLLKHNPDLRVCNYSRRKPEGIPSTAKWHHYEVDLAVPEQLESALRASFPILEEAAGRGRILLINNSGFGIYGSSEELDTDEQLNMLDLNVRAMLHLTGRLLPLLRKSRGAVINVASTAAFQPTPELAAYGATKTFVLNWSLALADELRPLGVSVMALCPGPTATEFFKRAGFATPPLSPGFGQTSEQVATAALRGLSRGKWLVVSGLSNRLIVFFSGLLPRVLLTRVSGCILRRVRK